MAEQARALEFDRLHHVETAREVFLKDAGVSQADAERGNDLYRAIWPRIFDEAIRSVMLDHSRFTFADYGAGKGMAMFLAAEYPFKKIVGVEFAPALHAIATQRCFDLSGVLGDASTWQPPDGPLLCFSSILSTCRRHCEISSTLPPGLSARDLSSLCQYA